MSNSKVVYEGWMVGLVQGSLLEKVLEAIKELVTDANFDCSATRFSLQAMDSSHATLVALLLRSEEFEHYHNISMEMNLNNMAKLLKCAGNDGIITLKADDGSDTVTVTFMFESPTQDKISDFGMKLMDIDSEHLEISLLALFFYADFGPIMEANFQPRMKRKEFEDVNDDVSDFILSSSATKIRRLDAELPPMVIVEEELEVAAATNSPTLFQ